MEKSSLRFFTVAEIAEILKMHPQVIARKLASRDMEGYKIGKDWRISEDQLKAFLERNSNQRVSSPGDKVIATFFEGGKLKAIPTTHLRRLVILKHLVSKLESHRVYTEAELNDFLKAYHSDICTLRREFIMNKLMVRKSGKYKVVTWQS